MPPFSKMFLPDALLLRLDMILGKLDTNAENVRPPLSVLLEAAVFPSVFSKGLHVHFSASLGRPVCYAPRSSSDDCGTCLCG